MSPPPGNKGGAVSGAGPCPMAVGVANASKSVGHTHALQPGKVVFLNFMNVLQFNNDESQAHQFLEPGNDWSSI